MFKFFLGNGYFVIKNQHATKTKTVETRHCLVSVMAFSIIIMEPLQCNGCTCWFGWSFRLRSTTRTLSVAEGYLSAQDF